MLLKLNPQIISVSWDEISRCIDEAVPPIASSAPDRNSRILESLLSGDMQAWAYRRDNGNIVYLALTTPLYDPCSNTKSLLIYCLYGWLTPGIDELREGFDVVSRFAKGLGCSRIVAYSDNEAVIKIAERIGAETKYRLLSFNLLTKIINRSESNEDIQQDRLLS